MKAETFFKELAELCEKLTATRKRNEKTGLVSGFLKGLRREEVSAAVPLILGWIFPEVEKKTLTVGFSTLSRVTRGGRQTTLSTNPLTILRVYEYFNEMAEVSGSGSRQRKLSLLESLLGQASSLEEKWILKNIFGEMQHGVNEGLMVEAVAKAADVDVEHVRRANMLMGNLGEVAVTALTQGGKGLDEVGIKLFTPVKPMLADMSYDLGEVLAEHGGRTAFEHKFDGARVQIHKQGLDVRVFSRRLSDVTNSLPEVVELTQGKLKVDEAIVEGEVIAVGRDLKPLPFQDLMRRFKRVHAVHEMVDEIPLKLYLFDILYLNGRQLIDEPYEERWKLLNQLCESRYLARRIVTSSASEAQAFLKEALAEGHEGLMAKALDSLYTPGKRGKKWFKIKPADRLDLVIVAADWGYGRRTGWLSNYHLAAVNPQEHGFDLVGKTFKGLTDEEFKEMTRRLLSLKVSETAHTVHVKPEVVVEVAYNEIQQSPHYRSGFALRFARITRVRDDKSPSEADTIDRIRFLYERQFQQKGRLLSRETR